MTHDTHTGDRPANEIEITEEMIAAGAAVLFADPFLDLSIVAAEGLAELVLKAALQVH